MSCNPSPHAMLPRGADHDNNMLSQTPGYDGPLPIAIYFVMYIYRILTNEKQEKAQS